MYASVSLSITFNRNVICIVLNLKCHYHSEPHQPRGKETKNSVILVLIGCSATALLGEEGKGSLQHGQ